MDKLFEPRVRDQAIETIISNLVRIGVLLPAEVANFMTELANYNDVREKEMNLTQLIKNMKEKGLISVAPINLRGKAKPVLDFWVILADTELEETDPNWWQLRLWLKRN